MRVAKGHPPHATSPSWVWLYLGAGREGTVQGRETPVGETTSTDVPAELLGDPPVISSTETRNNQTCSFLDVMCRVSKRSPCQCVSVSDNGVMKNLILFKDRVR